MVRGRFFLFWLLFASLLAWPSMADTVTFTFMPESSPPYPSGNHGSNSGDPLGPWVGLHVAYRGIGEGGSAERLNGAWLNYRFRLDFANPVVIDNIQMEGWGDHNSGGDAAVMRLLDSSWNVLATEPLTGWNVFDTWTLDGNGATGAQFFYDEFDYSGVVRYRSNLTVSYHAAIPEPGAGILAALGLAAGAAALRRKRNN